VKRALAAFACAALAGCSDGATEPPAQPDPPRPTTVTVSPATAQLTALGATVQLTVEVLDQNGQAMAGAAVTWSSNATAVATVDASGLVTGIAEGSAMITATSGDTRGTSEITVENPDRAALVALYEATDGPNWRDNTNWLTDAPLGDWYGVDTDADGRVVRLVLRGMWDDEAKHWVSQGLAGAIPRELGGLARLERLRLDHNELTGSIPPQLGELANLRFLDLSANELSAGIPPELGRLTSLHQLILEFNTLSGAIPPELGDLAGLWSLSLSGNSLSGTVPKELGNLVSLGYLDLSYNELSGPLPSSFLQLEGLSSIYFAGNEGLCVPGTSVFVAWLRGIEHRHEELEVFCNATDSAALESLFEATDGSRWTTSDGWLSDRAVEEWYGITADSLGRITALDLTRNSLAGALPASVGNLAEMTELRVGGNTNLSGRFPLSLAHLPLRALHYSGTSLCAPDDASFQAWLAAIPSHEGTGTECTPLSDREILEILYHATGGSEWTDNTNWLTDAPLDDWSRVTAWPDGRVVGLFLQRNRLKGRIPPELGSLASLHSLWLQRNDLTGPVPPELGNLTELDWLWIEYTGVTGPIPPELGNLDSLERLHLGNNNLAGPIPPELGASTRLRSLQLQGNMLSGPIPRELGNLKELLELELARNDLAGPVPPELGGMSSLEKLGLSKNPQLRGALPVELSKLVRLQALVTTETDLCAPSDPGFQAWLADVPTRRIRGCDKEATPAAYLVQAVQSRDFPVPLVAGERALLRVFPTASRTTGEGIPLVRARFYLDSREAHIVDIPGKSASIPTELDESSLSNSANAEIPGAFVQPGLEMVIEVDPEGTLDQGLGVVRRIPEAGRMQVDVGAMPPFPLTVIPFLWSPKPDSLVLETTRAMAQTPDSHELLGWTRTLLPIEKFALTVHEPVISSRNDAGSLIDEVEAIRVLEGGRGYYMGTITGERGSWHDGLANGDSNRSIFAALDGAVDRVNYVIAHELGHNLHLDHTPGCNAEGEDYSYPYPRGRIGVWGYDFESGSLVPPTDGDLMSYCFTSYQSTWISDYHFSNALRYRLVDEGAQAAVAATTRSLLLWGGMDADSVPYLEPTFVAEAPAAFPDSAGDYRLIGRDGDGGELFSLSFAMSAKVDGDGSASFAFVLPVRPGWEGTLASITLSGPGGSATLDGDTARPMVILRDPRTGQVRGFLRDPASPVQAAMDAAGQASAPGLEILFSRGIPDASAWRR